MCVSIYLLLTYKSVIVFFFNMHNEFIIILSRRLSCSLYFIDWDLPLELYMNSDALVKFGQIIKERGLLTLPFFLMLLRKRLVSRIVRSCFIPKRLYLMTLPEKTIFSTNIVKLVYRKRMVLR